VAFVAKAEFDQKPCLNNCRPRLPELGFAQP